MNYRLHWYIYTKKNPSHLQEKPGNWFDITKMWEKHLKKKEILRKGPVSLLKISLWDSFWFLLVQI